MQQSITSAIKLGLRLQAIERMVNRHYDHIWDCCCDHGLLGMRLLERQLADKVHFVDVVASLVDQVHENLSASPELFPAENWQTHCLDVAQLPIEEHSTKKASHLVIIAGVGGDLLAELVRAIYSSSPEADIEFLLCPVRQHYHVREQLINLGMKLVDESLVVENRLFYEIIHVSSNGVEELATVGSRMWNPTEKEHYSYLQQTIAHYQRRLQGNCHKTASILEQYLSLAGMFSGQRELPELCI